MGRLLGVDLGTKRVGFALSDEMKMFASPHKTMSFKDTADLIDSVLRVARENNADTLVIGLPIREDGTEGAGCRRSRRIAELLRSHDVKVVLWDERYSSRMAEDVVRQHGKRRVNTRHAIDAIAASFILGSFMDQRSED